MTAKEQLKDYLKNQDAKIINIIDNDLKVDEIQFAIDYIEKLNTITNHHLTNIGRTEQGDLFVQKSPASTIEDLASVLKEMFDDKSKTRIIGTRHGEKTHETLMTNEEKAKSIDLGDYYRIPADNRDLNYEKYLREGAKQNTKFEDYNSSNTTRLDPVGVKKKLLTVDLVKDELRKINASK